MLSSQRTPKVFDLPTFIVRPSIADSAHDLLDSEAEAFGGAGEVGAEALGIMFAGLADLVLAGESIYYELDFRPYGAPMSREITTAIARRIWSQMTEDGPRDDVDWSSIRDLAMFAADIEDACKQIERDEIIRADAAALRVSVSELLGTRGYDPALT